jgi:hypothetical protein
MKSNVIRYHSHFTYQTCHTINKIFQTREKITAVFLNKNKMADL